MSTLCPSFNTLECKGNYSATSNNASVVVGFNVPIKFGFFSTVTQGSLFTTDLLCCWRSQDICQIIRRTRNPKHILLVMILV